MTGLFLRDAAKQTGLTLSEVARVVRTGPKRYKTYKIRKRSGGQRTIAQPARELKDLQYFLMETLLSQFSVHDAAKAYRKGMSIRDNAQPHADKAALLKLDFIDFFGSLKPRDFDKLCESNEIDLDDDDRMFCHQILFWRERPGDDLKLSIGAPSSPMFSNAVMYDFDKQITNICSEVDVIYTRYADDLAFSSNNVETLFEIKNSMPHILRELRYPIVYINQEKTCLVTRKHRLTVTGLVLANDGSVSLGRDRKRRIRAAVHSLIRGRLDDDEAESLRGQLAFTNSVEPEFLIRLKRKYGAAQIDDIMKKPFRRRYQR